MLMTKDRSKAIMNKSKPKNNIETGHPGKILFHIKELKINVTL